jgi:hypothetical protein
MGNFFYDLKRGQDYEIKTKELYGDNYHFEQPTSERNREYYDLKITNKSSGVVEYVEVKSDFIAINTKNVAIEIEYRGKDSGLTITKADYYIIHAVGLCAYKILVTELKDIIKKCRIVYGGDRGCSKIKLVPLRLLTKYKI